MYTHMILIVSHSAPANTLDVSVSELPRCSLHISRQILKQTLCGNECQCKCTLDRLFREPQDKPQLSHRCRSERAPVIFC